MRKRPTPETDAVAEKINFGVDIDFARKLERERDEAREEIRDWKRLHDAAERGVDLTIAEGTISDLLKQRDEAREKAERYRIEANSLMLQRDELRDKYDTLATEHMLAVNKLCEERDEARAEIQRLRLDAQREAENHDRMVKELESLYDKLKS